MAAAARDKTIGYRLVHAARQHRARMAELLADLGLFPGQEQALSELDVENGRTMGELAAVLRVRPPTVSKMIARMAAQGLVEREAAGGDGRLIRVRLTDTGRQRARDVEAVWRVLEAETTARLDAKDRRRLRKLLRAVERSLAEGPLPPERPAGTADAGGAASGPVPSAGPDPAEDEDEAD